MTLAQTVFDMLAGNEYSKAATLAKKTEGTYNPATQTVTGGSSANVDCRLLFDKMKKLPDHIEIKEGDRFAYAATNGVEILPGDEIVVGSKTYLVLPGTCENSVGQNALFEVLLR